MSADPDIATADLASLVGSRICHDLISPLGAIGNGVELAQISGAGGPEMDLIAQSVASASARLRLFRLAFGPAEWGQAVAPADLRAALGAPPRMGRVAVDWRVDGAVERTEARLALLLLQCFETAMPYGGEASVERRGPRWRLRGASPRLRADPALWSLLAAAPGERPGPVTAAQVHFALAPEVAHRMGRPLSVEMGAESAELAF